MPAPRRRRVGSVTQQTSGFGYQGPVATASFPQVASSAPPPAPVFDPGPPPEAPAPVDLGPDPAYIAELARQQFERTAKLGDLEATGKEDETDTHEAIRRLLGTVDQNRQGITQSAARSGLLYSGQLGKRLDDFSGDVTRKQGDINLGFQRRQGARASARGQLEAGATVDQAAADAALVDRNANRAASLAEANALAAPSTNFGAYQPARPAAVRRPKPSRAGANLRAGRPRSSARGRPAPVHTRRRPKPRGRR